MGLFRRKTRRMPLIDVFTITDTILDRRGLRFCRLSTRMPRVTSGPCISAAAGKILTMRTCCSAK